MIAYIRKYKYILWIIIIVVILGFSFFGPLITLLFSFLNEMFSNNTSVLKNILMSQRKLVLLLRTILYSFETAVFCILISFFTCAFLWNIKSKIIRSYKWVLLIMLPVPPYLHALVWWKFFVYVNQILNQIGITRIETRGYGISLFVQIMAFLPIALAFTFGAFSMTERKLIDVARVITADKKVFKKIVVPLAAPFILFATGIIYILTFNDYSISSIFAENLYSLEVFVVFSSTNNTGLAILSTIPGIVSICIFILIINSFIKKYFIKPDTIKREKNDIVYPGKVIMFLGFIGFIIFILQILMPIVIILINSINIKGILYSLKTSKSEIFNSMFISVITSIFTTLFGFLVVFLLRKTNKIYFVLIISVITFALPGSIFGIGIIGFWNNLLKSNLYNTILMPILVSFIRFFPISIFIFYSSFKRVEEKFVEAGNIIESNKGKILFKIVLPMHWIGILISGLLVFVLTLGELGGTVLVVPPGINTLTIKIYNFLHYGASDIVYGLCLFILLISLAISGFSFFLINRLRGKENDKT